MSRRIPQTLKLPPELLDQLKERAAADALPFNAWCEGVLARACGERSFRDEVLDALREIREAVSGTKKPPALPGERERGGR